jgi:hypothetical protein
VTGLTGVGHRSDRCSTGSKSCKFPLCVLVCFGLEGCVLVSMTSSTPVATWSCPTWVIELETCVGSRVHLVGASICFEKNFYWLPFTPPSLVRRFGPSGTHQDVHRRQIPQSLCTSQTGDRHRSDRSGWAARDEQPPRVNSHKSNS